MRVRGRTRYFEKASKRKNETEHCDTPDPKKTRITKKNEIEHRVDSYCWLCHIEADENICRICYRAYHDSCLDDTSSSFSEQGACPECLSKSVDGTELNSSRYFDSDKLKRMLDVLTRRSFDKKKLKNQIFLRWPEEEREKLFKIIDFEILLDNINYVRPYIKTAEFYADVKFLCHNSFIVFGADSKETKAADNLRKLFEKELLDLEACPECYYYLYCDDSNHDSFIRLCTPPHDIVWAQLYGHSYWPAKCLKVKKGCKAHIKFFGKHEWSDIPISKCLYISESHPKDKVSRCSNLTNSGPKSPAYKSAISELQKYIFLYRRKRGEFIFYPPKTAYKPHEKQNEIRIFSTEGSSNRNVAQLKLEGIVEEDTETNTETSVIDASTIMNYSEDNLTFRNSVTNDITSPKGNLNTTSSAVTSINMTFSTHGSNVDVENNNPVVSSIETLFSTDTVSNAISSASDVSIYNSNFLKNMSTKKVYDLPGCPKETGTVCNTEIISGAVANDASNESIIQTNSLSSSPVHTDNHTESDTEVLYIGQRKKNEEDASINPDVILPMLVESDPSLKKFVQDTKFLVDGIVIRLWASFSQNSNYLGALSKLYVDLRKCKSELKDNNEKSNKEIEKYKNFLQDKEDIISELNAEINNLQSELQLEKEKTVNAISNANIIIHSLRSGCLKKSITSKDDHAVTNLKKKEEEILKKVQQLQDKENIVKSLEEENRCLKTELELIKVSKQSVEEKLKDLKSLISSDSISEYKRKHYCFVCERPAEITCCLNTSYCSPECQAVHAEEHRKECPNKTISQSVVQQRVSRQTVVHVHEYQGVITSEKSVINSQPNSDISDSYPAAGSAIHKRTQIHHDSVFPMLSTSSDHSASPSSRSCSSSSRRRYHK